MNTSIKKSKTNRNARAAKKKEPTAKNEFMKDLLLEQ